MPISALVLALSTDESARAAALSALEADQRITLGEAQENILPIVAETDTIADGIELVRNELPAIEGVLYVHVVSVDFSDTDFSMDDNRLKAARSPR